MATAGARELDVVLLGATGFTGGLVAEELARRTGGTGLRWGIAGRDVPALERLRDRLPGAPAIVRADVTDRDALAALAARTRVLATTVGPYARLGLDVARACAAHGTRYADITGEEGFVRTLEHSVDALARDRGATLVVCCGFDAVPHDLGAQLAVSHLPDDADVELRAYVRARGRPSGGTASTALDALSGTGVSPPLIERGHAPRGGPASAPVRHLDVGVHRPARLGGWAVPLPTVDPEIVLRSARALPGYGRTFAYGHYAHVRRTATLVAGGIGFGTAALAARTGTGRAMLERFLPAPGDGPDAGARAVGRFTVLLVGTARAPDGSRVGQVIVRVQGGDPGYGETSRMLAEAALTLAGDERPGVTGVVTPAVGLGLPYRRRLEAAGMRFEVMEVAP
jgi:saccharopine dehydrogenase (NAD+, L-glutamate forming)